MGKERNSKDTNVPDNLPRGIAKKLQELERRNGGPLKELRVRLDEEVRKGTPTAKLFEITTKGTSSTGHTFVSGEKEGELIKGVRGKGKPRSSHGRNTPPRRR